MFLSFHPKKINIFFAIEALNDLNGWRGPVQRLAFKGNDHLQVLLAHGKVLRLWITKPPIKSPDRSNRKGQQILHGEWTGLEDMKYEDFPKMDLWNRKNKAKTVAPRPPSMLQALSGSPQRHFGVLAKTSPRWSSVSKQRRFSKHLQENRLKTSVFFN